MIKREQHYLWDLFAALLEEAREAKQRAQEAAIPSPDYSREFEEGRALAYYEVLSSMVNQLDAFGIPRNSVGLSEELDLAKELF